MRMDEELEAVRQTGRRYTAADKARDRARDDHFASVLAALRAGKAPTDVAELSPFTATHLRQIARDAGIEAPATRRPPRRGAITEAKIRDNASGANRGLSQRHRRDPAS